MRPDKNTQIKQLNWGFQNHKLKPSAVQKIESLTAAYVHLGEQIINVTPQGREQSIALHELETSKMYAVKTIALDPAEQDEE